MLKVNAAWRMNIMTSLMEGHTLTLNEILMIHILNTQGNRVHFKF